MEEATSLGYDFLPKMMGISYLQSKKIQNAEKTVSLLFARTGDLDERWYGGLNMESGRWNGNS